MSGSGVGRGRGWLNLNKNNATRPVGASSCTTVPTTPLNTNTNDNVNGSVYQEISNNAAVTSHVPQYAVLIPLLEQLDVNDDGIVLNQKLKHIYRNWQEKCNSSTEIEESFKYVYENCLLDSSLAVKVVIMVSAFASKSGIHQTLRSLFIKRLQTDFESRKQMQTDNPNTFRNLVRMLGAFYHKGRLASGSIMQFLAGPVVQCLQMLLDSACPADLELFTSHLYLIGALVQAERPQEITELLMQIRSLIIKNSSLTKTCKTWLLLAIDIEHHRFGLLPPELQKFYQEQLGDKSMANFQGNHSALSIQTTHVSKTLDEYQSAVSVLQVTPPESTSPSMESLYNKITRQGPVEEPTNVNSFIFKPDCNGREMPKDSKTGSISNSEKMGRPILGVGARLQRSQVNNDLESSMKWNEHRNDNSTGWDKKNKGGKSWDNNKKDSKSGNRGYKKWGEHDDRFDTDY